MTGIFATQWHTKDISLGVVLPLFKGYSQHILSLVNSVDHYKEYFYGFHTTVYKYCKTQITISSLVIIEQNILEKFLLRENF